MFGFYFDQEGVVNNVSTDLAKSMIANSRLKEIYMSRVFDGFDPLDDEHWRQQRKKKGHSTGATPVIALMVAAIDGKKDSYLLELAESEIEPNPGADEMVEYAKKMGEVFLVTNSYPGGALLTAKRLGIPSSHVYSMGHQAEGTRGKLDGMALEEELELRSPLTILSKYRKELDIFLDRYLESCNKIMNFYQNGEDNLNDLINSQLRLFHEIKDPQLREELEYLLVNERGIMGGHRKAQVVDMHSPGGRNAIAIGDSIVDADMLALAQYGISVNCTNKEALFSCKLNTVVRDFKHMNEIFEPIGRGMTPIDIEEAIKKEAIQVYSQKTIMESLNAVTAVNKDAKDHLKKFYKAGQAKE
jgi:predicted HAD superfamily phosphohydrolase